MYRSKAKELPTYYYIVGESDATGRRIIYARKNTPAEAELVANSIHNAHCEVIPSKHSSSKAFAQELRAKVLTDGGDIDVALKRFKHLENKGGM